MQQKSSRGVQQREVDAAADALLAEGARPTVERVRVKIGRGSPNTVGPMLEAWFASLAPRLGVIPTQEAGGMGAPATVRQAMEAVWAAAIALARQQAEAALQEDRDRLDGQRQALVAARDELASQAAAAGQREILLRESLDRAVGQANATTEQLNAARADLHQREQELAEARSSIAVLVQQKDAVDRDHRTQLEAAAREREQMQQRSAASEHRHLAEVDRARQETKSAQKALADAEQRFAAQRSELTEARQALAATVHELQVERAALLERLGASEQRVREMQTRSDEAKKPARRVTPAARKKPARAR